MGSGDRLALCLHGFPEHAYSWRHQLPVLARLGYRCWAPNLRGYGNTDSPRDVASYRTETLVADVAGLIKASGARETLLMAHDWGGALAWMLAKAEAAGLAIDPGQIPMVGPANQLAPIDDSYATFLGGLYARTHPIYFRPITIAAGSSPERTHL